MIQSYRQSPSGISHSAGTSSRDRHSSAACVSLLGILLLAGCTLLEEGTLEDLPRETLDTLASMDWLPRDDANF